MQFASQHLDRVAHVHLKDVRGELADAVRAGRLTYLEAVGQGMYVPYGEGDVDLRGLVRVLEGAGYQGMYVTEIEARFERAPEPGEGPVTVVAQSIDYLAAAFTCGAVPAARSHRTEPPRPPSLSGS